MADCAILAYNGVYILAPLEPKVNQQWSKKKVLQCLKNDQSIKYLPADKGNCTIFKIKTDYAKKVDDNRNSGVHDTRNGKKAN